MYENTSENPSLWFKVLPLSQAEMPDIATVGLCMTLVTAPQIELMIGLINTTDCSIAMSAVPVSEIDSTIV